MSYLLALQAIIIYQMPDLNANQTMPDSPAVFLPDIAASFTCARCGVCCAAWEIPVDRAAYDRAVAALGDDARNKLAVADPHSHYGYARLLLDAGRCGFQEKNLCRIHRDHGEGLLFPECRKFPRILFRTPVALHCTASFACPQMLAGLDRPDRVRVLHVTPGGVSFPPEICDTSVTEPPCLCRGKRMAWDAFPALESGLLELLHSAGGSLEARLLTVIEFARSLTQDDDATLQKSTVDRELQAARVDSFHELGSRFLLASHDVAAQAAFILSLVGTRLRAGTGAAAAREWERRPLEAVRARWGSLPAQECRTRYLDDCRRLYLAADARVCRILENYVICRIAGNPEFVLRDTQAALQTVAALLALSRAAAVALAATAPSPAGTSPIAPKTMLAAIRAVDTAFFHLPDFADLVRKQPIDPVAMLVITPG